MNDDKDTRISEGARKRVMHRKRYLFDCLVCETTFVARDPRGKFCSNRCRQQNKYDKATGGEYA